MEYFMRLSSSVAKFVANNLKLRNKVTGKVIEFPIIDEKHIEGMKNPIVSDFDMTKLEVEYDYDTDNEQVVRSKEMLLSELL